MHRCREHKKVERLWTTVQTFPTKSEVEQLGILATERPWNTGLEEGFGTPAQSSLPHNSPEAETPKRPLTAAGTSTGRLAHGVLPSHGRTEAAPATDAEDTRLMK